MPSWGITEAVDSPFTPSEAPDVFCEVWSTIERCAEFINPTVWQTCSSELQAGATPYPAGFAAPPPFNPPAKCRAGIDQSIAGGTTPGYWYPFNVELRRDGDLCEGLDPEGLRSQGNARLRDLMQLAVLRQLWGTGDPAEVDPLKAIEPRSLSISRIMRDESSALGPSDPHGAWGTLVANAEGDDWVEYTILAPAWALGPMIDQSLAFRGPNGGWVDPYDQPIVFGGQLRGWRPESLSRNLVAPGTAVAAAPGEGYLVAVTGPVWYALSEIRDARVPGNEIDERINQFGMAAYVQGLVMAKECDCYGVRTVFHSLP